MKPNSFFILVIDFFKDYWKVISIMPFILGGFWQFLELSSISFSFLRFFSASQILADGLLVTFYGVFIFLPLACFVFFVGLEFNEQRKTLLHKENKLYQIEKLGLMFFYVFHLLLTFGIFYVFLKADFKNVISHILVFVIVYTGEGILFSVLANWKFKKMKLILLIFMSFCYIFVNFILFIHFDKSFIENMSINQERAITRMKKSYSSQRVELRYFNDKYLFISLNDRIEVVKFEALFEK